MAPRRAQPTNGPANSQPLPCGGRVAKGRKPRPSRFFKFTKARQVKLVHKEVVDEGRRSYEHLIFKKTGANQYFYGNETHWPNNPSRNDDGVNIMVERLPPINWFKNPDPPIYLFPPPDPNFPTDDMFLKGPDFRGWRPGHSTLAIEGDLRNEVTITEILRNYPHPNVAGIFGWKSEDTNHVTGTYYQRYQQTLYERLRSISGGQEWFDAQKAAKQMRAAVKHLHGIQWRGRDGLVHGDIKPDNFCVDENDDVYLIDFDSACWQDQALPAKGGTQGYYSTDNRIADKENDLWALEKVIRQVRGAAKRTNPKRLMPPRRAKKNSGGAHGRTESAE